uniref:Prolyl-tRNA synthetase associated domain-containing protein 1 isoform X2 n=1 Tax=Rhizophora mucronata TaxID=61149 RepID=A0A2P2JUD4_RHIMU
MGFTKEQLLARLKELQIDFSQYEHPVVLTVEAQVKLFSSGGKNETDISLHSHHLMYIG